MLFCAFTQPFHEFSVYYFFWNFFCTLLFSFQNLLLCLSLQGLFLPTFQSWSTPNNVLSPAKPFWWKSDDLGSFFHHEHPGFILSFFFLSPSGIKFHMCRPIFTDSESILSLWSFFFFSVCRFLLILCQYDIVRCSHLLFSPHLSFLYCDLFLLFFFMDTGISCFLCLYTIQFALEILSSLCGFILSFLALIFAFPPVLLPKAEQLWYISISNMLSYASPQIKLICSFHASHLLEHLLLASCLALSFNLWIFIVCFSLLH